MDAAEDDDIRLQRASANYIHEAGALLDHAFWKKAQDAQGRRKVHRLVRKKDVDRIVRLIEPFQEDPQLLDAHLKTFLPPLVDAYLAFLQVKSRLDVTSSTVTVANAICRILNVFCKVRGEKIIIGFLNNEPRYLELILEEFERGQTAAEITEQQGEQTAVAWEERYILLLWLSHLMLAPFDLATISSETPNKPASLEGVIDVSPNVPELSRRVLQICINHISSPTKERDAAASLLVRLIIRPDMRKLGLLDTVLQWSLSSFAKPMDDPSSIHQYLGLLSFLSRLTAAGTTEEIGVFLPQIYKSCMAAVDENSQNPIKASAVARKLIIKILRSTVVHCLQSTVLVNGLDVDTTLEDVIDYLLRALADGDTPVRYAASKALSLITLKLEPEMAAEVIEAILGCLNEDVLWEGSSRNLSAVNPLRWHGLALTLSHLLYRKAPSTDLLPNIVNALLLALTFEQRSATGSSIGTNVRDAANFGIWALSRRYTSKELLAVHTKHIRAAQTDYSSVSVLQALATELVAAACLDPAGNIRRGSSAALQELIGRHPDTVIEGITLVQTVDFHAVGLRERAMCDVAVRAAKLSQLYWNTVFSSFLGWRGVGALDAPSREWTGTAIARLSSFQDSARLEEMVSRITGRLQALPRREIEERHGLYMTLASIINQNEQQGEGLEAGNPGLPTDAVRRTIAELSQLQLWNVFSMESAPKERDFTSTALRPELTATAVCSLLSSLCGLSLTLKTRSESWTLAPDRIINDLLTYCLARTDPSTLLLIPSAVRNYVLLIEPKTRVEIVQGWLTTLSHTRQHSDTKGAGRVVALGAVFGTLTLPSDGPVRSEILSTLTARCTTKVEVQARTVALQSLRLVFPGLGGKQNSSNDVSNDSANLEKISTALLAALNDYTINERGDVGSLVRLEALKALEEAWRCGIFSATTTTAPLQQSLLSTALRLSVEKLDKVRLQASQCLLSSPYATVSMPHAPLAVTAGVSSYTYFSTALGLLNTPISDEMVAALLEGYISSTGLGSESVLQSSRLALVDALSQLPVSPSSLCSPPASLPPTTSSSSKSQSSSPVSQASLLSVIDILVHHLTISLPTQNDRLILPLLETFSFLFDMGIMQRLVGTGFKWRTFLSVVQKSHYKSSNVQKLRLALDVYRGLGEVDAGANAEEKPKMAEIRELVLKRVIGVMGCPFPSVRFAAAETLFLLTSLEQLKQYDWSRSAKELKSVLDNVKLDVEKQLKADTEGHKLEQSV